MDKLRDMAMSFEAFKVRINDDHRYLVLEMHPDDVPADLLAAPGGQRFIVALVPIDTDEQPIAGDDTLDANRSFKSSIMLAKSEEFQRWCVLKHGGEFSEASASQIMMKLLGIKSRNEIKTDKATRERFKQLRSEFVSDFKKGLFK